jgi:hypothetical protein
MVKEPPEKPKETWPIADEAAIARFAKAMVEKMAIMRTRGLRDWETCSSIELLCVLEEHVEKGDPVDIALIAMMIHQKAQVEFEVEWQKPDGRKIINIYQYTIGEINSLLKQITKKNL